MKLNFVVCTRCFTYNHSKYIVDAMNGFTMQQTSFPFVCCIVDDASTDDEQEIIKHYLEEHFDLENKSIVRNEETDDYKLCFTQHKTNINCYFAVLWLKYNHYKKKSKYPYITEWFDNAKYIAICEGDDYWITSNKLQQQFNYMEDHADCSLVFHNAYIEDAETKRRGVHKIYNKSRYTPLAHIIRDGGFIPTASILYRQSLFANYAEFPQKCPSGDIKIQTYAALVGRVYYLHEIMSVYRLVSASATHVMMAKAERWIEYHNQKINWLQAVNEYTHHKYEKEVKGAIVFAEVKKILAQKKYYKLWNPKYYVYIWNKPMVVRVGILISMCGFGSLSLWGRQMLYKLKNGKK